MRCWLVLALIAGLTHASYAVAFSAAKEQPYTITYFNHPSVPPLIDVVRQVYREVGIEPQFKAVPRIRGFKLLNSGVADADVVRARANVRGFDNILIVEPALAYGEFLLVCLPSTQCELEVLANPEHVVISPTPSSKVFENMGIEFNAKLIHDTSPDSIEMLRKRRVDYVLYGSLFDLKIELQQEFQLLKIANFPIFHVVHKRNQHLIPQLSDAIRKIVN